MNNSRAYPSPASSGSTLLPVYLSALMALFSANAQAVSGDDTYWDFGVYNINSDGDFHIHHGLGNSGQFEVQEAYSPAFSWGNYGFDNVFTGDFDGDGNWDIGLYNPNLDGRVFIRLGDGLGNFPTQKSWDGLMPTQYNPDQVFTGNFNGTCDSLTQCLNRIIKGDSASTDWETPATLLSELQSHGFSDLQLSDVIPQAQPYTDWRFEYQLEGNTYCLPNQNVSGLTSAMKNHLNQAEQVRFVLEDGAACSNPPVAAFTLTGDKTIELKAETSIDLDILNVQAAAGGWHSCGISSEQQMKCWGRDSEGQISDLENKYPDNTWITVTTGTVHTCGITTSGIMHCWGGDSSGQVSGLENNYPDLRWASVSASDYHTCGITRTGMMHCWGRDTYKQVSDFENLYPNNRWLAVAAGGDHTCGITTQSVMHCWGSDSNQQVSDLETKYPGNTWKAVAAGDYFSCGINNADQLLCWGRNDGGSIIPPEGHTWQTVSAGGLHACGIDSNAQLFCWGSNLYGQTDEPQGYAWLNVEAGSNHTCGVDVSGQVRCWGQGLVDNEFEYYDFEQTIVPVPLNQPALTYNWNFGDGNTATGVTTTHTYNSNSEYLITLELSDGVNTSTATQTTIIDPTDIAVTLTGNDGKYNKALQTITYEATIANLGNNVAENVVLTNTLPLQVSQAALNTEQSTCDAVTATCNIGTLAPGQRVVVTIVATTTNDKAMNFYATVTTTSADSNLDNNSVASQFGGSLGLVLLLSLLLLGLLRRMILQTSRCLLG